MLFLNPAEEAKKRPDAFYESCIGKIAEGDNSALGVLYEHTKSAVFGFALSITKNLQDAEDVLQDTYVSIMHSAPNYNKMGKPMAWILTIAKNLSLMRIRMRKKTEDISEGDLSLFAADVRGLESEDKILLDAALKMSLEDSRIVILHAVTGFKHREIAKLLELPLSTVLSKYSRAVKKLKAILKEGGVRDE